jgi:hypothetical protein
VRNVSGSILTLFGRKLKKFINTVEENTAFLKLHLAKQKVFNAGYASMNAKFLKREQDFVGSGE